MRISDGEIMFVLYKLVICHYESIDRDSNDGFYGHWPRDKNPGVAIPPCVVGTQFSKAFPRSSGRKHCRSSGCPKDGKCACLG